MADSMREQLEAAFDGTEEEKGRVTMKNKTIPT